MISLDDTSACMCHDAESNNLWSRTYIVVPSVHFVFKTMLPVAANIWKSGQGI
jgi:hypothetical protein